MARKRVTETIVLNRRSSAHDEEEHNGTWKLAYADFVTAMMTFFLIMWLVNVTTIEQREGIADYFNPVAVSTGNSGADAMLAGRSVDRSGVLTTPNASGEHSLPVASPPVVASVGDSDREPAGRKDPMPHPPGQIAPGPIAPDADGTPPRPDGKPVPALDLLTGSAAPAVPDAAVPSRAALDAMLKRQTAALDERLAFQAVEREIRTALESAPDLKPLAASLVIEQTPEGLRIQLTDQARVAMFAVGASSLNEQGRQLMRLVARALAGVPNGIAITGHTDALGYAKENGYGNWELSSDRANAARRELNAAGVPVSRITRVEGRAALDPLLADAPADPRNRRISITVLRSGGGDAR